MFIESVRARATCNTIISSHLVSSHRPCTEDHLFLIFLSSRFSSFISFLLSTLLLITFPSLHSFLRLHIFAVSSYSFLFSCFCQPLLLSCSSARFIFPIFTTSIQSCSFRWNLIRTFSTGIHSFLTARKCHLYVVSFCLQ